MRKIGLVGLLTLFVSISCCDAASADEQLHTLAIGGDWIAASHSLSMTDAADVCVAVNAVSNLALRADNTNNEIRFGNTKWSLPENVTGIIEIKIRSNDYKFPISANDPSQVTAVVSDDDLQKLVADMNVSSIMTVGAGSAPPINVSLAASNAVITAFLTCAGKSQPGSTGGVNPFGSPKS